MRGVLALAIVALLFSGCAENAPQDLPEESPEPSVATEAPEAVMDPVLAGKEAPTWNVGKWWAYNTLGGRTTRVVTQDAGEHWIVGTDSIATAFFDAKDPISNMGPQRKVDLAGSQADGAVSFFKWPLTDGELWRTTWDGRELQIQATDNQDGTWSFEGQHQGNVYVDYIYDPAAGWMQEINFYRGDATLQYSMQLNAYGDTYDGNVVDLSFEVWIQENITGYETAGDTPGVPPESTDLWLELDMQCSEPGAMSFVIGTSENTIGAVFPQNVSHGAAWHDACPGMNVTSQSIGAAPYPEDWGYTSAIASGDGHVRYTVYARTYEFVPWVAGAPA